MNHKLTQIQTQRQILAPVMQQSIAILFLPIMELNLAIEQELQVNPLLEIDEEAEAKKKEEATQVTDELNARIDTLIKRQEESPNISENNEDAPEEKSFIKDISLEEGLLRQLRIELSDPADIAIGEFIIGNLNEDGFLTASVEEIARLARTDDISHVRRILSIVQGFEPAGIASRGIHECLLTQLKSSDSNGPLMTRLIHECLEDLGHKRFSQIAHKLEIPLKEAVRIAQIVATLDPRPARNFRPIANNIYIKPDIFVTADERGGLQVTVNNFGIPHLRINTTYKNMLSRPNLSDRERIFIREKLENAILFLKSIEQRGQTVREITQYIVNKQKMFFEGNYTAIAPLTLKEVAGAIKRNESTVSRAIHHKYMETPQGLFPLKYFFSQSLSCESHEATSSQSIKEQIKELVDYEDKRSPLSDRNLQKHFSDKGVKLARRTINKYREALQIPASYMRKELR